MRISPAGLDLIARCEGFSPTLYDDPAGNATIGYGILVHLGPYHRQPGDCALCDRYRAPLTEPQARAMLAQKVQPYAAAVERLSRPLSQPQFDALASLCYNIGPAGYERSSVRRAVNARGDVCAELRKYVRGSDGKTYPGLVRRREAECAMFNSEEQSMTPDDKAAFDAVLRQLGELGRKQDELREELNNTLALAVRNQTRIDALERAQTLPSARGTL
ncbi:MAG TPA: lysozyme [Dehalococcoidia bacterium]|nr:lysozyme [Dehalococcoidia bacterium]